MVTTYDLQFATMAFENDSQTFIGLTPPLTTETTALDSLPGNRPDLIDLASTLGSTTGPSILDIHTGRRTQPDAPLAFDVLKEDCTHIGMAPVIPKSTKRISKTTRSYKVISLGASWGVFPPKKRKESQIVKSQIKPHRIKTMVFVNSALKADKAKVPRSWGYKEDQRRILYIEEVLGVWPENYRRRFESHFVRLCTDYFEAESQFSFRQWAIAEFALFFRQAMIWARGLEPKAPKESQKQWKKISLQTKKNLPRKVVRNLHATPLLYKVEDLTLGYDFFNSRTNPCAKNSQAYHHVNSFVDDIDFSRPMVEEAYEDFHHEPRSESDDDEVETYSPRSLQMLAITKFATYMGNSFDYYDDKLILLNDLIALGVGTAWRPIYFLPLIFERKPVEVMRALDAWLHTRRMVEQGDDGVTSSNLESSSSTSSSKNITFVDERPVDTNSLHTTGDTQTSDTQRNIVESPWTIDSVLTREYPYYQFEWSVGLEPQKPILITGLPQMLIEDTNSLIYSQLRMFAFLRSGVHIRVQLNGTKFHLGRLLVYFKPLTWKNAPADSYYSWFTYPHFFLDASVSNSGELTIPFTHLLSYFSQLNDTCSENSINALGSLRIMVFNQLRASEGAAQNLYGTVYANLVAPKLHLPCHPITNFSYGTGIMQAWNPSEWISKGVGTAISALSGALTGGLIVGGARFVGGLLGIMDKPHNPLPADPLINRTVAPISHGAGMDQSIRLALCPISQTNSDPQIMGASDSDFNLLTICQIPGLLQTIEWSTSQDKRTRLWSWLVSPVSMSNPQYQVSTPNNTVSYYLTPIQYVSRAFIYWRGTLRIKIQVVATQFHSGRLLLVYDPHASGRTREYGYTDNLNFNSIVMDIQEKQEIIVDIPFYSIRPWQRCNFLRSDANMDDKSTIENRAFIDCDCTGIFHIFVLNSLVAPSNVPGTVNLNIFMYAGDDFELSGINPVNPLAVHEGLNASYFGNIPHYPWCLPDPVRPVNTQCRYEAYIYDLLHAISTYGAEGKVLPNSDKDKWWDIKMNDIDSATYSLFNRSRIFKIWYDGLEEDTPCKTMVDRLKGRVIWWTKPSTKKMVEQGDEAYTTTRDSESRPVPFVSGRTNPLTAAETTSENAMNLQTVMRRYYPMWISGSLHGSTNFHLISIPVSPSYTPKFDPMMPPSECAQYFNTNNLAWFAQMFTYWRGSLRYKVLVSTKSRDIYVWHNPIDAKTFNVVSGFQEVDLLAQLNFASEVAVTQVQQGVEVEVPFYSAFNQLAHHHGSDVADLRAQNGTFYIAVRSEDDFNISVFISTGDDFMMNVLRAPPVVREIIQMPYVDADKSKAINYPELQRDATHGGYHFQIPGYPRFNRFFDGGVSDCQPKKTVFHKPMTEQMFSALQEGIKSASGVSEVQRIYSEDVKPVLEEVRVTVSEFRNEIAPSLLGRAKVFHQNLLEVEEQVAQIVPKVSDALEHVTALTYTVNGAYEQINDAAKGFGEVASNISYFFQIMHISAIWFNLTNLMEKFTWTGVLNILLSTGALLQVNCSHLAQWLWQNVTKMFTEDAQSQVPDEGMTEQGFEELCREYEVVAMPVLAAIATVVYCSVFTSLPTWEYIKEAVISTVERFSPSQTAERKDRPFAASQVRRGTEQGWSETLKEIHFSNMGMKAIAQSYECFHSWLTDLLNWYLQRESPAVILKKEFDAKSAEILDWIDKIAEFEDQDLLQLALSDIDAHNRLYYLVDRGREYTRWALATDSMDNKAAFSVIRDANKRLNDLVRQMSTIQPGHGFRKAPFTVMLHGGSGLGKSNVMSRFTQMFKEAMNCPNYNSTYSVPKTDKFLDGYQGQPIIEWDDMLQCTEEDYLVGQFINWRSNADCIVNKARIEEKGCHFTSRVIIMTTNCADTKVNTIRQHEAFRNRINVRFDCHLAEGFTPEGVKKLPFDPEFSFLRFRYKMTNEDGTDFEDLGVDFTLREALQEVRMLFQAWDRKQQVLLDNHLGVSGSMKIPKGVVLDTEPIGLACMAEQLGEREAGQRIRVLVEESLSEEENLDAEIFRELFDRLSPEEQLSFFQRMKKGSAVRATKFYDLIKKKWNLARDKTAQAAKSFYESHPKLTVVLGILGSVAAVGFLIKFFKDAFVPKQVSLSVDEAYAAQMKTVPKVRITPEDGVLPEKRETISEAYAAEVKVKPSVRIVPEDEMAGEKPKEVVKYGVEQGSDDPFTLDFVATRLPSHIFDIEWRDGDGRCVFRVKALAIGGKVILCPHHFFRRYKEGLRFCYIQNRVVDYVDYNPNHVYRIGEKDAVLYYMGPRFDSRSHLVDNFLTVEDYARLRSVESVLLSTGQILSYAPRAQRNVIMTYQGKDPGAPEYRQVGWGYAIDTAAGWCGSPLLLCNRGMRPPARILGIHVAGYDDARGGFSICLTAEMLKETIANMNLQYPNTVVGIGLPAQVKASEQLFEEKVKVWPEGSFAYCGVMDDKFCPSQPSKTSFRRTPFGEEIAPLFKKPAMLRPHGEISPLRIGLSKFGKVTIPFGHRDIAKVRADMLLELLKFDARLEVTPLDERTTICGAVAVPYCQKMDMNSSPGWPYQCLPKSRGQKGKSYLFDLEEGRIDDSLLRHNFDERERLAKEGIRVPSIWRDCLKDELRPIEKVEKGKTRLFNIAPVDFTLLTRKYCLAFEQMFYSNHDKFFSSVGINCESFEWTAMYHRLAAYGDRCVAGDFSSFDGTLMADLIWECGQIISDWYFLKGDTEAAHRKVRDVIFDEIIHTHHLVLNCVYKTHQGNPSGNPMTVIINTMVNAMYMRLAWLELARENEPGMATMIDYHDHVIEQMYGDDNRLVIKEPVVSWYNQVTITRCLARHGITYTDESKSSDLVPYRDLKDTTFLKRAFRWDPEVGQEIVLPAMDIETIFTFTHWYRDGGQEENEQILSNQRDALDFAFFHGRKFYDDFNQKLINVMLKCGYAPQSITYDEQLDRFLAIVHGSTAVPFTKWAF